MKFNWISSLNKKLTLKNATNEFAMGDVSRIWPPGKGERERERERERKRKREKERKRERERERERREKK